MDEKIEKMFREFDYDESGTLDIEEITEAFAFAKVTPEQMKRIFKVADKDADGELTTIEYFNHLLAGKKIKENQQHSGL
jgi:Ca2+-binding EF-hand superfamily protein